MLHVEYRPDSLDSVYGNEAACSLARAIIEDPTTAQAVLLHGPSGTGKTTLARIIAKEIGVESSDLLEFDIGDFRGIETIRTIRSQMVLSPMDGERRAYILDEAHQLTKDAQNGLLKALEEPPSHVSFFLCTTEAHKLLKTIRTRCFKIETETMSDSDLEELVGDIAEAEEVKLSDDLIKTISSSAMGCPREALVILESVLSSDDLKEQKMLAEKVGVSEKESIDLCRAIMKRAPWKTISVILQSLDANPESVRLQMIGYFSKVLLGGGKEANRAWLVMDAFSEPFYDSGKAGLIHSCYTAVVGED